MARIGRPPLYNNCMDLDAMCELYFEERRESGEPVLISELPLYVGFGNRQAIYDLEDNPEFSGVIKKARWMLETECERAMMKDGGSPIKHIFRIKQPGAGGWVDRQEVVGNTGVTVQIAIPEGPTQAHVIDSKDAVHAIEQDADSCVDGAYVEVEG